MLLASAAGTEESKAAVLPYVRQPREEGGGGSRGRGRGSWRGRGRGGGRGGGGRGGGGQHGQGAGLEGEEEGKEEGEEGELVAQLEPEPVAEEEVAAIMDLVGQDLSHLEGAIQS